MKLFNRPRWNRDNWTRVDGRCGTISAQSHNASGTTDAPTHSGQPVVSVLVASRPEGFSESSFFYHLGLYLRLTHLCRSTNPIRPKETSPEWPRLDPRPSASLCSHIATLWTASIENRAKPRAQVYSKQFWDSVNLAYLVYIPQSMHLDHRHFSDIIWL